MQVDKTDSFGKYHVGKRQAVETGMCFQPGMSLQYLRVFSCLDHKGPRMR